MPIFGGIVYTGGMPVEIITDAIADFTEDEKRVREIKRVSAGLVIPGIEDPESLADEDYLRVLETNAEKGIFPQTAAMGELPFLMALPKEGEAVIITTARKFTRLKDDADEAAKGKPVKVIEGIVSAVNGWMALDALDMAKNGSTSEEISLYLEKLTKRMRVILELDTMKFLKAGGRAEGSKDVEAIALALGSVAGLKPVIEVTSKGLKAGLGDVLVKVRSKSVEKFREKIKNVGKVRRAVIVHAGAKEATEIAGDNEILTALGLESLALIQANKFEIAHIGPKAMALCCELAE